MVEGLTQEQVKDLIIIGAFHYEALLRERDLIDDTQTINGVVTYSTWEPHVLAIFAEPDFNPKLIKRYLPNAYIRSKATVVGALTLATDNKQFEPWRANVLSNLTQDERQKVNPYLPEVFETSQKLAAEARPQTQKVIASTPQMRFTTNRNQRIALVAGTIFFVLMLLFPPWHFSDGRSRGYHFLFWPPYRSIFIDSTRLLVQCVFNAALTLGAFVLLRTKRP
jgi:hypothetical protein